MAKTFIFQSVQISMHAYTFSKLEINFIVLFQPKDHSHFKTINQTAKGATFFPVVIKTELICDLSSFNFQFALCTTRSECIQTKYKNYTTRENNNKKNSF